MNWKVLLIAAAAFGFMAYNFGPWSRGPDFERDVNRNYEAARQGLITSEDLDRECGRYAVPC